MIAPDPAAIIAAALSTDDPPAALSRAAGWVVLVITHRPYGRPSEDWYDLYQEIYTCSRNYHAAKRGY